jgi:DNA-binding NarL/FixJ family response regulator
MAVKSIPNCKVTLIIAESNQIYLEGLKTATKKTISNSARCFANNVHELDMLLKNIRCDILLAETLFLGTDLENIQIFRSRHPLMKIIALSSTLNPSYIIQMMKAGCDGFLLKNTDCSEVELAVKTVLKDKKYLNQNVQETVNRYIYNLDKDGYKISEFVINKRFREMLFLICYGYTSKEIAEQLFVSKKSIDKYRYDFMKATGVQNVSGLILFAINNQIHRDEHLIHKYSSIKNLIHAE